MKDFKTVSHEEILVLLGYDVGQDSVIVEKETGEPYRCPYSGKKIPFDRVSILPHPRDKYTWILINTSALSKYIEDKSEGKNENK